MAVDPSDRSSLGVLVVGSDAVDLANRVQNLGYTAHTFRKKSEIKGLFKDGTVNVVIHNYDGTGIVGRARRMSLMGRIQMSTNGDFLAHRICSGDFYVSQEMLENDLQRFHAASALSTGLDAKIDDPFFEQLFMFNLAKLKEHLGVRDKAGLLYMLPESMPTHRELFLADMYALQGLFCLIKEGQTESDAFERLSGVRQALGTESREDHPMLNGDARCEYLTLQSLTDPLSPNLSLYFPMNGRLVIAKHFTEKDYPDVLDVVRREAGKTVSLEELAKLSRMIHPGEHAIAIAYFKGGRLGKEILQHPSFVPGKAVDHARFKFGRVRAQYHEKVLERDRQCR